MIYAIEVNGIIERHDSLPKVWNNTAGYRGSASAEQIYKDGFRELVIPKLSKRQSYGKLIYVAGSDHYTYEIVNDSITAQELYDKLIIEADEIFNDYKKLLIEVTYEALLKGKVSKEMKDQVIELELVKARVLSDLDNYLANDDIISLNTFTFDTPEAEKLRDKIKKLK